MSDEQAKTDTKADYGLQWCRHFRVVYTRPTWGGRIMRRRECRNCGERMTTWET